MSDPAARASPSPEITNQQLAFEREKWLAEQEIHRQELELKVQEQDRLRSELQLRIEESKRSRWSNPLVLAIIGAALAAIGNAGVSWLNGRYQSQLEDARAADAQKIQRDNNTAQLDLENVKAEAERILESIKTNDPDKAAENLKFLLESGLISTPRTINYFKVFLATRSSGQGPVLPSPSLGLPTACPFDATKLSAKEFLTRFEGNVYDKVLHDLSQQVKGLTAVPLSDKQTSALISLVYNVGIRNVSSVLRFINEHDFQSAADAFLLWDKAHINGVLEPVAGMHARRLCERDLFLAP